MKGFCLIIELFERNAEFIAKCKKIKDYRNRINEYNIILKSYGKYSAEKDRNNKRIKTSID